MSVDSFLEVLDRAHNGPICTVENWDSKVLPEATMRILKEHGLQKTCDRNNPVNTDDGLAKNFFQAALELAVELGMLCTNTERVIKVGEEELKSAIREGPRNFTLGEGRDKVKFVHREPEDTSMPIFGAPLSIGVTEDVYVRLMEAIVRDRLVDVLRGGSLITVRSREIRSGTPYETVAGRLEADYLMEALRRACRPGMPTHSVASSVTDLAQFTGYGTVGGKDPKKIIAGVLSPSELKTTYTSFNKVAHAICLGGRIASGSQVIIGGFAGPAEGAALVGIAGSLLRRFVHGGATASTSIMDSRYSGNGGPEAIWASSIAIQSLSNNTDLIVMSVASQTAGPDTDMLLYETGAIMMNLTASGASYVTGPRSAGGKWTNHLTPLECGLSSEVLKGCRRMKRTDANQIIREIIPRYGPLLGNAPKGSSVLECYNLEKLKPTEEWAEKYVRAKRYLVDLGATLA